MLSTIPLASGLLVRTRENFTPLLDASGQHRHDRDGQPIYAADCYVPGALASPFARPGEARPGQVRVRVVGDPHIDAGAVVRLDGAVRLSTWSQRVRGVTRTDVTVTSERVVAAPGERPVLRGALPVAWAGVVPETVALDYVAPTRQGDPGVLTVGIAPVEGSPWVVDGVGDVFITAPVPDDLLGVEVVLLDPHAAFYVPDEGGRDAARLLLGCARVEPAHRSNGRTRKPEPTVEAAEVSA
ncbi:MAG: hypothetical protein AB7W59_27175 [Acidimicrobiia bacterium]